MTDSLPLSRMSLNLESTGRWPLDEALRLCAAADIPCVGLLHSQVTEHGVKKTVGLLRETGLRVSSFSYGGPFVATSAAAREEARTWTRHRIDDAAALGAPVLLLQCGASPNVELAVARQQALDGIHAVVPHAKAAGVKLALEPYHPMYAENLAAVNTLDQANNMVLALDTPYAGVAIDVYHTWWDPFLRAEIDRAKGTILCFQVADWRTPQGDLLQDRALMGEGCIPMRQIRSWVERSGYDGVIEVEAPSRRLWELDPQRILRKVKNAFTGCV